MVSKFIEGDIQQVIKDIPDNSIDLIYTSPPFGITEAKWDKPLDWNQLWPELWRVMKSNGIIVLHASMPFTYELLQYERPKYHYTWKKNNSTNFFKAKLQPLRNIEEIFVYYKKPGTYNPQMVGDKFVKKEYKKHKDGELYFGTRKNIDKTFKTNEGGHKGKYPTTFLEYKIRKGKTGITRPDEMMDYFIKTYSNENDTILDLTTHNDFLSKRCNLLNRNFIGVDIKLEI